MAKPVCTSPFLFPSPTVQGAASVSGIAEGCAFIAVAGCRFKARPEPLRGSGGVVGCVDPGLKPGAGERVPEVPTLG